MRVSRKKALKNRELVINAAARLLREHGLAAIGVVDITEAAGQTHGGFYRNFTSMDYLATLAIGRAASTMKAAMLDGLAQLPDRPFRALAEYYNHRIAARNRAPAASSLPWPPDAARSDSPALRAVFMTVVQDYLDQLARFSSTMPEGSGKRHPAAILPPSCRKWSERSFCPGLS